MTHDRNELEKFAQLANTWWDPKGPLRTLHHINPCRVDYIKQHTDLAEKKLLDLGCGGGILSEALWQNHAIVTAIDLDASGIAAAIAHQQQSGSQVDYQVADVVEMTRTMPAQYDIITCMEMLEHVPDPALIIAACANLLKPGGYLFLSTINRTATAYALAVVAAEYVLRLLPRGTHDYQRFIKPAELVATCCASQLTCIDLKGLLYNPLTTKARLGKDLRINYLACFKKN